MKQSKGFLSRLDAASPFTLILVMVIAMVAGAAVIPLLDVEPEPLPRQGKTLTVTFRWPDASPKVVEQNVTSRIEGVVSSVKGVESVSSVSNFGGGRVEIELKPQTDVSAARFEIASTIRQIYKKFPEKVTYPELSGGEVVTGTDKDEKERLLLSYQLNSAMTDDQLKEYVEGQVEPVLKRMDGVRRVEVTGGTGKYVEISYDPMKLHAAGITVDDIEGAVRGFMGRTEIVGEIKAPPSPPQGGLQTTIPPLRGGTGGARKALYLGVEQFGKPLERMPVKNIDGTVIYLGDLASYEYKDRLPGSYYRLNGLSTIYLNIYVDPDASLIRLSHTLQHRMKDLGKGLRKGVYLSLSQNTAEKTETELTTLVRRSLMSLLILLVFVFLVRRKWKYLFLISTTLAANILIAVLIYWLCGIRLHTFALAGITVSLGIIIDSSIVIVDHYLRHRDRNVFFAILAALLTTIGALVIIFFLPEHIRKDLYDFSWIIIINLTVSLAVALLFVPALAEKLGVAGMSDLSDKSDRSDKSDFPEKLTRAYTAYIRFTQKRRWIYIVLLMLAFGGSMRLFADHLKSGSDHRPQEREKRLVIRGQMPVGGSMHELNDKMLQIERFLSGFPEISKFETRIGGWGGQIEVEFDDEHRNTGFPYMLENKVIGQLISLGGADWSTFGVSERGFSNSLNLAYRSHRIEIAGYNYDRLYRYAEEMSAQLGQNPRVQDIVIETPGHENQEDELYMVYDKERMALDGFSLPMAHAALREILAERELGHYKDRFIDSDIKLSSERTGTFDHWQLDNSYIDVNGQPARLSNYMEIARRQAKNSIPRKNQEYVLRVAFNVLGSWNYSNKLIESVTDEYNARFPVGYRCLNTTYGWHKDEGTQYWLLLLVVVIIYFVCAILFESLTLPLAIISLIPISFIGTFLTFYFTGVEFGNGGFASMVLLAGIVVNAGIYQVYEYKVPQPPAGGISAEHTPLAGGPGGADAYVRAFRIKAVPVFLTILSTVLGLVPFLFDHKPEGDFWYSLAVGSMGGLLMSALAYVFILPIFLRLRKETTKSR